MLRRSDRAGRRAESRAKITVGRAGYIHRGRCQGLDDHLSGAGEAPGRWCGAGASVEGAREVTAEQMAALFESADARHLVTVERPSGWLPSRRRSRSR